MTASHKIGSTPGARSGRTKQRYGTGGERCIAGCIPLRLTEAGVPQVLMITRSSGKGYIFPKGGWEVDETAEEAAERECREEAGISGVIEEPPLGEFAYRSGKANEPRGSLARMFVLRVTEERPDWPEAEWRVRQWVSLGEAHRTCKQPWMQEALAVLVARRGWSL